MKKVKNKKKNKFAFTLIELLATIVIIIIIFLIAMFVIPNIMGGVYKRVCSINEGMMEKSAFNYFSLGKQGLPTKEGESKEVTLDKLITSQFIKEIKDPKTKLA
ncbi:MAG: prepilin-type N-terminal cleavage/methylation domain-containing protein, partial [Bacilli bacterium]|nr:prepilin-type N-terminal cleavage/methylation domain-containing protein [Bacilli bacterium]